MISKGWNATKKKPSTKKGYALTNDDFPEMKPTVHLSDVDLPEISKWKVGQTYTVTMKIRQTGMHENYDKSGKNADFEIESVEADD